MPAITAVILVGNAHPNNAGNRAFAQISLDEGSRQAFVLNWMQPPRPADGEVFRKFTMIPTIEHMLDDSILMVAYAVCRHPKVFSEVNRLAKSDPVGTRSLHMHDDFIPSESEALYAIVKGLDDLPKVTWCLFGRTTLNPSMGHLDDYKLECEVTSSMFCREYDRWSTSWRVRGKNS